MTNLTQQSKQQRIQFVFNQLSTYRLWKNDSDWLDKLVTIKKLLSQLGNELCDNELELKYAYVAIETVVDVIIVLRSEMSFLDNLINEESRNDIR